MSNCLVPGAVLSEQVDSGSEYESFLKEEVELWALSWLVVYLLSLRNERLLERKLPLKTGRFQDVKASEQRI